MKYYLIAGERSGDLHASNLIASLKKKDPSAQFRGVGGEYMKAVGVSLYKEYKDIAFMGLWEVVRNLRTINKIFKSTTSDIVEYQPDVLILVDFGGFNMKMARYAKERGMQVYYYISPKVWAWYTSRAKKIKKYVDKTFVILPFEKDFFKQFDYEVDYVGNPVCDAVAAYTPEKNFREKHKLSDKPIIAILAGSRKQEVGVLLTTMLEITPLFPQYQFVVAAVSNLDASMYDEVKGTGALILTDQTYDILSNSYAAVVTSGTATLETALFNVPQVVCYKTHPITYMIGRPLVTIKHFSLPNLIAGKEIVTELLQKQFNKEVLQKELEKITMNEQGRAAVLEGYALMQQKLGSNGASEKAATLMYQYLQNKKE